LCNVLTKRITKGEQFQIGVKKTIETLKKQTPHLSLCPLFNYAQTKFELTTKFGKP
jgi:ribosomal protein L30E